MVCCTVNSNHSAQTTHLFSFSLRSAACHRSHQCELWAFTIARRQHATDHGSHHQCVLPCVREDLAPVDALTALLVFFLIVVLAVAVPVCSAFEVLVQGCRLIRLRIAVGNVPYMSEGHRGWLLTGLETDFYVDREFRIFAGFSLHESLTMLNV